MYRLRRSSVLLFRLSVGGVKLCEEKRKLEVDVAIRGVQAREKAAEEQLKRLPEHHQQLLQVRPFNRLASFL